MPLLEGARDVAAAGFVTGASGRNWASYREDVTFSRDVSGVDQALLRDPQTSGGLLVACAASVAAEVHGVFCGHCFAAVTIGHAAEGRARLVIA